MQCLLVQGWNAKLNWTFPKGKVNCDENDLECACREVFTDVLLPLPLLVDTVLCFQLRCSPHCYIVLSMRHPSYLRFARKQVSI